MALGACAASATSSLVAASRACAACPGAPKRPPAAQPRHQRVRLPPSTRRRGIERAGAAAGRGRRSWPRCTGRRGSLHARRGAEAAAAPAEEWPTAPPHVALLDTLCISSTPPTARRAAGARPWRPCRCGTAPTPTRRWVRPPHQALLTGLQVHDAQREGDLPPGGRPARSRGACGRPARRRGVARQTTKLADSLLSSLHAAKTACCRLWDDARSAHYNGLPLRLAVFSLEDVAGEVQRSLRDGQLTPRGRAVVGLASCGGLGGRCMPPGIVEIFNHAQRLEAATADRPRRRGAPDARPGRLAGGAPEPHEERRRQEPAGRAAWPGGRPAAVHGGGLAHADGGGGAARGRPAGGEAGHPQGRGR